MKGWYKESYRHYLASKGVKTNKWFKPAKSTGWKKDMNQTTRISMLMQTTDRQKSLREQQLEAARRAQALANVTVDEDTKKAARKDAELLFKRAAALKKEYYYEKDDEELAKKIKDTIQKDSQEKLVCDVCGAIKPKYGTGPVCEACKAGRMIPEPEKDVMGLPRRDQYKVFNFEKADRVMGGIKEIPLKYMVMEEGQPVWKREVVAAKDLWNAKSELLMKNKRQGIDIFNITDAS